MSTLSSKHHTLVRLVENSRHYSFWLLIKARSGKTYLIKGPGNHGGWRYENDGVLDIKWSKNSNFLAFGVWGSGENMMNIGGLYVYSFPKRKLYDIRGGVMEMHWISNDRLAFHAMRTYTSTVKYTFGMDPKVRYWQP